MKNMVLAVVAAVLASVVTVWWMGGGETGVAKDETAYERVMRTGVVRCGVAAWPPYYDIDPNTHEVRGYAKDFAEVVFKLLALKVEYVPVNIATAVQDMAQGRFDALCFDGPWVVPAAKVVDYTRPWLYGVVFAYGKGKREAELNAPATRFIGLDGDLSVDMVPHAFPRAQSRAFPGVGDYSNLFLEIEMGRADAVIIDDPSFQKYAQNNATDIHRISSKPVATYPCGMSVAKGETKLLNMLDVGIEMAIGMGYAESIARGIDPDFVSIYPVKLPYEHP